MRWPLETPAAPACRRSRSRPARPSRTVKQLAGKTIAVNALAGLTVLLIDNVLAENGMSPSQVHYVVIPFPAMGRRWPRTGWMRRS